MDGFCTDTANKMSEVCSYCDFIALRPEQSLCEEMLLSMRGEERISPFDNVEKQTCVPFVKQSKRSRLLPAATPNRKQIETLKKQCTNFQRAAPKK